MKYGIYSKEHGWLVLCDATSFRFSNSPTFIMDFVSATGAKGFLDIFGLLHPSAPTDCTVEPWLTLVY